MKRSFHALYGRRSGLTLIEILVGLAVLGVILAVAVPSMADLLEKRRVIAAAEEVASILNYAKAETNSTNSTLMASFDPATTFSCALVATAASFNRCQCNRPEEEVCLNSQGRPLRLFQLPKTHVKFDASATWAPGQMWYVIFNRDQSTIAVENFHVDVVGLKKGYALRVEVNAIGRVKVCSPPAAKAVSGYGACMAAAAP